jgi:protoheme IX farnesyltransferase
MRLGIASDWSGPCKVNDLLPSPLTLTRARAADYLQLVRPRLALLVLFSAVSGWLLAGGELGSVGLVHTAIGTALLFAGASALNQLLERHSDALMPRTADRPLPSGRLQAGEVLVLGLGLSVGGVVYLLALGKLLAAGLGSFALVGYVLFYTPLKRRTSLSTLVGAVPGAVPPLLGWTAFRGSLDAGGLALFLIVLFWQVPHFLAIAWIYRDEYARAGLPVLPVIDPEGARTGRQMVVGSLALLLAALLPAVLGLTGWPSGVGAGILTIIFLWRTVQFARTRTVEQARWVFRTSVLVLPALFLLLVLFARPAG